MEIKKLVGWIFAGGLALGGCVEMTPPAVSGLESFAVSVDAPTNLGSDDKPATVSDVYLSIVALDALGQPYTHDLDADVFLSYGGNKIGQLEACGKNEAINPLTKIHLPGGAAHGQKVHLTSAFGKANLWVQENISKSNPPLSGPRAYGSSPEFTFPYPKIPDVQTPLDFVGGKTPGTMAPWDTYCSPFNGKQVKVVSATGAGKLVVTSVFDGAYVVADTGAPYNRPTDNGGFNHMYVFTFGRPPYFIQPGRVLSRLEGNVSKFVGFTELNFPYQEPLSAQSMAELPVPVPLMMSDKGQSQSARLIRISGATVVTTAKICPIDVTVKDWIQFNQFSLDYGDPPATKPCDPFNTFSVALPSKTIGMFDPLQSQGKTLTVTGMLRNFSGQNEKTTPPTLCYTDNDCAASVGGSCVEGSCKKGVYNFWIINIRDINDIKVM